MSRRSTELDEERAAAPIDLAHEESFTIAHLTIVPAALCLEADSWSRRLEPRAMQVLVMLARAAPDVVGRGELNARVWGGRVVGEDAINRAVQILRRAAADAPAPAPFSIETVPRVGYRLLPAHVETTKSETGGPPPSAESPAPRVEPASLPSSPIARPGTGSTFRRLALPLALLAALVAAIALVVSARGSADWTIVDSSMIDHLPPGARDVVLSPDGRWLAYRGQDLQGRDRIFVRTLAAGGAGSPTSPAGIEARRPVWSPDSARLAFAGYDPGRPCRLFVGRPGGAASMIGSCETVRDPRLAWSVDGGSLLLGDAPGENAVQRIGAVRLSDGHRSVLSSPPGDSLGDGMPLAHGKSIVFQRQYGWADEGWIARDLSTGRESLLWRRRGVAGSVAAALPDGSIAIAWTQAGASGLDVIARDGRADTQPLTLGTVTAMSAAQSRLLIESDRSESALVRVDASAVEPPLAVVRGRISGAVALSDGQLRIPVTAAGLARIWTRDVEGALRPWGGFVAARLSGLAASPDARLTSALATGKTGREIVLFDARGRLVYRWNPRARSLNAAAWSGDGKRLIAPVLDGAGWRLLVLDPFGGAAPRDLRLPGFAVVQSHRDALYAVRAGETTGVRELWRLDGSARRLPIDLTLHDIVNWRAVAEGIWLPDRGDRGRPRLVLRDIATGSVRRSVAAPGLAEPGSGLAADASGPVYVKAVRDDPEYGLLTLAR